MRLESSTTFIFFHQHKEFEEIEGRLQRHEPLILGSMVVSQRLGRRLPVEVISDPLENKEIDPYEDGSDVQKHLRGHQVHLFFVYLSKDTSSIFFSTHFVMYVTAVVYITVVKISCKPGSGHGKRLRAD